MVLARRQALAHWIKTKFGGSQAAFIESTSPKINQGEVSGLLRNKSFREKRAEALERQAKMPEGYLVRAEVRASEAIQPSHKTPSSEPAALGLSPDAQQLVELIRQADTSQSITSDSWKQLTGIVKTMMKPSGPAAPVPKGFRK